MRARRFWEIDNRNARACPSQTRGRPGANIDFDIVKLDKQSAQRM
jgi:hypothetical protein